MTDLAAALESARPKLRGELEAEAPLAPISWFRAGGAAELLFTPADVADLQLFLATLDEVAPKGDVPILTIGLGSNLLVRDGGVAGVVIRLGEGFMRVTSRARREAPRRSRRARHEDRARRREIRPRRPLLLSRHPGHDRRGAAHECRRLWGRDQGRARRGEGARPLGEARHLVECRDGLHLSALRRARGPDLRRSPAPGTARRHRDHPCRDAGDHRQALLDPAGQHPHRGLDLQEPAGAANPGS